MARQLDKEKRENILKAALDVFGRKGFAATTVKDIADLAGVAPGSVYTYFQDKVDLFSSVTQQNYDIFMAEMTRIFSGTGTTRQKVRILLDEALDLLKELHPLVRGMYSESLRRNLMSDYIDRFTDLLIHHMVTGGLAVTGPFSEFETVERRYILRLIIVGTLFDMAMTPPEDLDAKVDELKLRLGSLIRNES